jgi:hypothetical protein
MLHPGPLSTVMWVQVDGPFVPGLVFETTPFFKLKIKSSDLMVDA